MSFPSFSTGEVLTAADMNAVGLWLVKTQTVGTGVSSIAVTNAFSADYEDYVITFSGGAATTTGILTIQLGSTTTAYKYSLTYTIYGGATLNVSSANNANIPYVGISLANGISGLIEVRSPQLAANTMVAGTWVSQSEGGVLGGIIQNTTQYTGFTIGVSAGTITGGTIRVYGRRK